MKKIFGSIIVVAFLLSIFIFPAWAFAAEANNDFIKSIQDNWSRWSESENAAAPTAIRVQHLLDIIPDSSKATTVTDAVTLAAITRYYSLEKKGFSSDKERSISPSDLIDSSSGQPVLTETGTAIAQNSFCQQMLPALQSLATANFPLYANGQPTFTNVQQNKVGDCFLISAIGYMVSQKPELITGIVTATPLSTAAIGQVPYEFFVKFPNGAHNGGAPYKVTLSLAELAFFTSPATLSDGVWEPVIQKATAVCLKNYYGSKAKIDRNDVLWNLQLNHSPAAYIQEIFTGCSTPKIYYLGRDSVSGDKVAKSIVEALKQKRIVQAMKGSNNPSPQYPGDHWYAIIGYDKSLDTISIWNPWGDNHSGRKNGVSQLAVSDFVKEFEYLVIQP
ncbi:MAG: hypothetical protein WCV63_03750 [Negativicutes bacterium]